MTIPPFILACRSRVRHHLLRGAVAFLLGGMLVGTSGCASTRTGTGLFSRRPTFADKLAKNGVKQGHVEAPIDPHEGEAELEAAKALFEKGKFAEAEKAYKRLVKKYKDRPAEEEAMFYLAESRYEQGHFPSAQDSYDELIIKYTSTRYMEASTRRLFHIAQVWLGKPKAAKDAELRGFGDSGEVDLAKARSEQRSTVSNLVPNFFVKNRPLFDTDGRALQALKSIWLHDPLGPLADDAIMMAATHHMRKRSFEEADYFFSILRTEYPQSEHTAFAYILGSHVKLLTYQGAGYDGRALEDARKLTESTIRLYSDAHPDEVAQLRKKLDTMDSQTIARDFARAKLYERKGHKQAAAFYYQEIVRNTPDSSYADLAANELKRLGPKYLSPVLTPMPDGEILPGEEPETEIAEAAPAKRRFSLLPAGFLGRKPGAKETKQAATNADAGDSEEAVYEAGSASVNYGDSEESSEEYGPDSGR